MRRLLVLCVIGVAVAAAGLASAAGPAAAAGSTNLGVSLSADHSSNPSNPAVAGETVAYTATVTNAGPNDNTGYTLTLDVPQGTSLVGVSAPSTASCSGSGPVVCTSGGITVAGSPDVYTLTLSITPSYADSAPTALAEHAALSSLNASDNTSPDSADASVLVVANADLGVGVVASPNGAPPDPHAVAGTVEDYTITVTNNGPSDAVGGYQASAPLPIGTMLDSGSDGSCSVNAGTITCDRSKFATLSPSGTDVFHVKLDVAPGFADASSNHQATLTFSPSIGSFGTPQPANSTGNDSASVSVTVYAEADLAVAAVVSPSGAPPGAHAVSGTVEDFTITVTNNGPSDAAGGYRASAPLPANTSLNAGSDPSCSASAGTITCDRAGIDPVSPSGTDVFHVKLDVAPGFADASSNHQATLTFSPSVGSFATPQPAGSSDNDSTSVSVTVYAEADLAVAAVVSPSGAPPGAHAVSGTVEDYKITVTNAGPSDSLGGYQMSAPLPAGTSLDSGSDGSCSVNAGTITCDRTGIDPLVPSAADVFHVKLDLAPGFADTSSNHQAALTFSPSIGSFGTPQPAGSTGNDSTSVSVTVYAEADLAVAAAASPSGAPPGAHAVAGTTVEDYTITVTNNGPSDSVGGYKASAPLPAGTTLDSGSDSSCSVSAGTITCDRTGIGPLSPSAADMFHVELDVAPGFADASSNHRATLTFSPSIGSFGTPQPAGSTGNDSTSVPVTVYAEADLAVTAVASPNGDQQHAHAVAGTAEDYTITVTNNGPSDSVGGYKASAPLPAGTTLNRGSDSSCSASAGTITCDRTGIGPLSPSAADVFHIKLDVAPSFADGSSNHQATLTFAPSIGSTATPQPAGSPDNDSTSVSVTVYAEADLAVAAVASPSGDRSGAHAVAGATVEDYTITVTNNGPSDSVGGYKASAPLPAGTTLDSGSDSSCGVSAGTITCDRTGIATLSPSATDGFHIKLDLAPSFGDSSSTPDQTPLTLTVTLGSFGTPQPANSTGNDSAAPTITVYSESDLTITKTESTGGPIFANGDSTKNRITFTITVSNAGPSDAHSVAINDTLNANLLTNTNPTYCQGSGCTATTPYTGSISIGALAAAGGSQTSTIVAHANPTLGHATASSSPTDYRQAGPYTNSNAATVVSTTPAHSGADSRGPTPAVTATIDTVPASPTIKQAAVGGNAQAGVEWNPSSSNGGKPITSYTLKACTVSTPNTCVSPLTVSPNPNAPAAAPTYFSYVISGLTNGVQYQFTVVATNAVGDSDPANAGTAYASTSALVSTIPSTGTVSADTGIGGGALTCTPFMSVNCKNVVASYAFSDTQNIGAIYNLDAEPDTGILQCLMPASLDPRASGFGTVVNSPDCGPSNKVITETYPLSNQTPHADQIEFDSSITTFTRGTPCFAYTVDSTGTAQCTDPSLRAIYTDPSTQKPTNFCPAEFNPSNTTGWSSTKPCAFVYYLVESVPGYDIICSSSDTTTAGSCFNGRPTANRPVKCDSSDPNCGVSAIIGSSSKNGITENGKLLVPAWCDKSLTVVPCVDKYQWLNGDSSSSPKYLDVLVTHHQIGDPHLGGSSG